MSFQRRAALALIGFAMCSVAVNAADIELVGVGTVAGNLTDRSGLTSDIFNGDGTQHIPQNILGGFGSGIAYLGLADVFVAVSDRGPFDGITNPAYKDRFHIFRFTLNTSAKTVTATLFDTRLFKNKLFQNFVGQTSAFDTMQPGKTLRFDPEGVRVSRLGHLFVSDEYGPYIYEFNRQGRLLHKIRVPEKFLIDNPNASGDTELTTNAKGRQPNRGMEGLAISPDGRYLFGLMQNPLTQDGALDAANKRIGINTRLLEIDLLTGRTRELVYQIEPGNGDKNGMNEIVAVNDREFLVIERDGKAGNSAATKKIYHIDTTHATDVSHQTLPQSCTSGVDCAFVPVTKTLLIDMLSPDFGLQGASFPEKVEGLAFGPDLPDHRHVLYVSTDNDLNPANPSYIYAFAISPKVLPNFRAQRTLGSFLNSRDDDDDDDRNNSRCFDDNHD